MKLLLIGDGEFRGRLQTLTIKLGLENDVFITGYIERTSVYQILYLSSNWEGLFVALLKAMAAGLPCITTDVGDAARVVQDSGIVISPGDIEE